jgi:hypothetical protein
VVQSVEVNRFIHLYEENSTNMRQRHIQKNEPWRLGSMTDSLFAHHENDFVSFNVEKLMPRMLTTEGPKISVGDVNGDKLEDFFVGGAAGQPGAIFLQMRSGGFLRSSQPLLEQHAPREDVASALFDADGNGTLDLFVCGGGQQFKGNDFRLLPTLYLNDGQGKFTRTSVYVPKIFVDASCVKPADYDGDGDIDVFIGGRVVAGKYGIDPQSYILINGGDGVFTDQSERIFSGSNAIGMVTDAVWVDVNNDQRTDLVVVGEWMPVTIYIQNAAGKLENKTSEYNLHDSHGWWNTIVSHDFDSDGDEDFVIGNVGLNSRLRASVGSPVEIFIQDIDKNGSLDQILSYYNEGKQHPFISRDQLVKQVPSFRRKFLKYASFKDVQLKDIIDGEAPGTLRKRATTFSSIYLENTGASKFNIRPLPPQAQWFPIFSFDVQDINNDGHSDLMAVGNLYAVQPDIGRYDAGYGLVLLGDGSGRFHAISGEESGFFVPGEGRDIQSLTTATGDKTLFVARNNATVLMFRQARPQVPAP